MSTQTQETRKRCLTKIRKDLAYELDEHNKFNEFGYQKEFKKAEMQNTLLGTAPVWKPWLFRYLSDYFGVNIVICCRELLVYPSFQKERTSLLLVHEKRRLYLVTQDDGNALLDPSYINTLMVSFPHHLERLFAISRYKAQELKNIAQALHIPIQKTGKNQSRKKDDLYRDIQTVLGWLVR